MVRGFAFPISNSKQDRRLYMQLLKSLFIKEGEFVSRVLGIFIVLLSSTLIGWSQSQLKGCVSSSSGEPVEATSVCVRQFPDSTLIAVAITDSLGCYSLPCPKPPCIISYSSLGFKPLHLMCSDISDIPQQVVLEEETETLDEVVVVARAIQTKPIIGGIECKIRNKTITGNRSIADLLSYIPLVATSGLESLRVADKKNVVFYINGRRSRLSPAALFSYLRSLTASQLSSLKVLHQPPLEYGVDDDCAVIDLVVNDDNVGFQGSLRGEIIKTHYWKQTGSTTLLYQTPQWHTQMYLSARNLRDYERGEESTHYFNTLQHIDREREQNTRRKQFDFNLTTEYELVSNHLIGASVDWYNYRGTPEQITTTRYRTMMPDSVFSGAMSSKYTDSYWASALYYQGQFSNGIRLSMELAGLWSKFQHQALHKYRRSDLQETPLYLDYQAQFPMKTDSYEAKIKARIPLSSKFNLYAGSQVEYRKAFYAEIYDIARMPIGYLFNNQDLKYNETTLLSYALVSYAFPYSITCYGGLYAQYYKTEGAFNQDPLSSYSRRWYLLPYLDIAWSGEKFSITYSFSTSNYYHNFASYSPFKQWHSITTYSQGDPTLRPTRSSHQAVNVRYKNLYTKLFYSKSHDTTLAIPIVEDKNVIAQKELNYGDTHSWGISFGYGLNVTSWWFLNGNASISRATLKPKISVPDLATFPLRTSWFASGSISNAFTLSERHHWTADFDVSYSAPSRWGYETRVGMMQCNFRMRKSLGSNTMLSLWGYKAWRHSMGNHFHEWGITETQTPHFQSWNKSWGEDLGLSVSFTYYFGKSSLNQRIERHSTDSSRILNRK